VDGKCFVSLKYWVRVIWVRQCLNSHTNQIHNRRDSSFQIFLKDLLLQAQECLQKVKHNGEKAERIKELREYKEGIERNRDRANEGDETSDSDEGAGEDNERNEPSDGKNADKEEGIGENELESKDYGEDKAERVSKRMQSIDNMDNSGSGTTSNTKGRTYTRRDVHLA